MIRFADPLWLALLPVAWGLLVWRLRAARRPAVTFSSVESLKRLPRSLAQRFKPFLPWMEALGLSALCVAMARPQSGWVDSASVTEGVTIQLVVDRSGSMREADLDPNPRDRMILTRLDVVKEVVHAFVSGGRDLPGRPHDLIGLVSFAGFVQVHCPLTADHELLLGLLAQIEVPESQQRDDEVLQTAIGDAIVMGVSRLQDTPSKSRVMVLLSDGSSNIGVATPRVGAESAEAAGVKIYTIGVGSVRGGLDESTLKEVADITGGQYFNARSMADLREIYRSIDQLERTELETFDATHWKDQFPWWAGAGLVLLVSVRVLSDTRFRSLP